MDWSAGLVCLSIQEKSFSKTWACAPPHARSVFTEQSAVKAKAVIAYLWRWSSEEMRNDFDEEGRVGEW